MAKILLRVLAGLLVGLVLLIGGFYFVACGPLNGMQARQLAAMFERQAEEAGLSEHVSYQGGVGYKGVGEVIVRPDFAGLDRAEVSRLIGLLQDQNGSGGVDVRKQSSFFRLDGVNHSGAEHTRAAVFDATAAFTGPGTAVAGVAFDRTGRMVTLRMPDCADARCRLTVAADVLPAYPELTRAQLEGTSGRSDDFVCLRLQFGQDRAQGMRACTAPDEEVDPDRLRAVLETGVSHETWGAAPGTSAR
ncbi:hypothetical protein EAH68_09350 [Corynebacterium hylobatis]|uniref:Uncharacterized protein n=1 Tax=Corynebacterium hylobatis TaxID=1859290 RepID=A0A430HXA4_9CORY|nr:hypothetical protein [Corynebacterium hylobatis]RSZ62341.1 hypothetical protein EAH68_09350 [Corynebacterium hylobatis]